MLKEKYISEAQMKEEPKKKLALKIKEGSITPEHFNKRLVDEYLISVVDSVEDTGMLPEDKAKLDALPTAEELQQALDEKQNDLTFDSTPTVNSNNPVKSKGIKAELDKKQDKLTNGWVVQIKDEEAGSSGTLHKPKLINEDGNEVNVIVGATDRYSGWEQGGDTRIPTIGLVKEKLAAIDVSDQIGGKANKSEMSVVAGTGANADKTTITLKSGTSATVLTQHQDVSEFIKEGEVFGTGDDSTASFNPYSDTVWNKSQTLSESQRQQIRENIGVGAADNEDIQNVSGELKFADKAYNTSSHSGLGRKYLRKNIVDNKNVLTQAMVNTANTIYHIQYDYDLNGQTITIPAGCVLEFDGGSVCNGLFVGDKMTTNTIYTPEMFGAGKTLDDTKAIQSALNICKKIAMDGDYNVYSTNEDYYSTLGQYIGLIVPSDTIVYQNGIIRQKTSNTPNTVIFLMHDVKNVSFIGHGKYIGSVGLLDSGVSANEYNHCFEIAGTLETEGSSFITIDGGEIFNFYGDCINIKWRGANHNITIKNIELHHHGRASVAISGGHDVLIENIYTHDWISGITAKQDVSLETHVEYNPISNVTIKNSMLDLLLSNTNNLQSYFYGIQVIDSCINTVDMLSLYSDSIISNNKIVTKCRVGSVYTPSISNCEISGYIDLFSSVRYKGCTATGLFTDSSVTDAGQLFLLENCTFTFTPEAGNNKAEMYIKQSLVDNLVMENSTILWVGLPQYPNFINGTFNRCNLSFYDNVTGSVKAFNSKIDIKLLGSNNYVFNANIELEKCNIHVGSRYTSLYNLNRDYVINQYSIVEDDAFARKRTENNGTELVDNYTIYKSNNIFEDEYIDVGEDSLIPSINTPQKVQYEYDNTVLGNTKLTLRLINDYTRVASIRNTNEYVANSISKDTIIRLKVVQYNTIPTLIFTKTNNSTDDGIQVPFVLLSGDSNNAKGYSTYFRAPDPAIYPYIYVVSSYAGYTIFYVAKYVMRWEYGNGYMAVAQKGTTSERPTTLDAVIDVGFRYFDITLNKPIYWNGTGWVDATGTTV